MLRVLGGFMIMAGCLGLGLWYREQFNGRLKAVRELIRVLELLAGEVGYGRSTLPECCRHAAGSVPAPFDKALGRVGTEMRKNTGKTFGEVFREEFAGALDGLPLRNEDKESFLQFTRQASHADGQMQLRAMEQGMELLCLTEKKLERENEGKGKMAVSLGAMGGMLLIIILL